MAIISFIFSNLWWMIPLCITIWFYYLIYNALISIGRYNIFTTLLITLPLRLITGLFKGLIASITLFFYGFITLLFIFLPFYLYTHWEIFKDLIVYISVFLIFAPFVYFIFKVFKEELNYYKELQNSK